MNIRIALAASAALAALAAAPIDAGREWFQDNGSSSWTHYNYLNFERYASVGVDEYSAGNFGLGNQNYFLHYISNNTATGHCYEIELKEPENYAGASVASINLWFWDSAISGWTDFLGFGGKGKVRLWIKNSTLQAFLATQQFPGAFPRHFGFWTTRKNLTESQCTTGQSTMNWLKIIDGTQSKNIQAR
jgi:hypothetical protein